MANSKNEAAAKVEETKAAEAAAAREEDTRDAAEDDRVEVFIPKGYAGDEPNLFVSVNGKNFLLPRGKKSKVPAYVAYEINRAIKAQEILDQHIDEMKSK